MAYFQINDVQIIALKKLWNINLDVDQIVPFASVVDFILVKKKGNYEIKMKYNNKIIDLKNSNTYDGFIDLLKKNTYKNNKEFMNACLNYSIPKKFNKTLYVVIAIIMFFLMAIIWGLSWFCAIYRKKSTETTDNEDTLIEFINESHIEKDNKDEKVHKGEGEEGNIKNLAEDDSFVREPQKDLLVNEA